METKEFLASDHHNVVKFMFLIISKREMIGKTLEKGFPWMFNSLIKPFKRAYQKTMDLGCVKFIL